MHYSPAGPGREFVFIACRPAWLPVRHTPAPAPPQARRPTEPETTGYPPPAAMVNWNVADHAPGPAESTARTRQKRVPTGSVLVLT
jgi:hypothetical protein